MRYALANVSVICILQEGVIRDKESFFLGVEVQEKGWEWWVCSTRDQETSRGTSQQGGHIEEFYVYWKGNNRATDRTKLFYYILDPRGTRKDRQGTKAREKQREAQV